MSEPWGPYGSKQPAKKKTTTKKAAKKPATKKAAAKKPAKKGKK